MSLFLMDSDILINHLRRVKPLDAYTGEPLPTHRYGCSTIVVAEVYVGMRPEEEPATRQLLESLIHFAVTSEVAERAAELKRRYQKKGATLTLADCLIAATCLIENATLVTLNAKDYPMLDRIVNRPIAGSSSSSSL